MRGTPKALLVLLVLGGALVSAQPQGTPPLSRVFEDAVTLVDSRGNCQDALPKFEQVAAGGDRALAARALVYLGACYERLGNEKARQAYRRVLELYPDQPSAASQARARLAALDRVARSGTRLTLRPLWDKRPGLALGGRPTVDGRWLPLLDGDDRLVVTDITLGHRAGPVPIGQQTDRVAPCTPDGRIALSPDARQAAFVCEATDHHQELRLVDLGGPDRRERLLLAESAQPLEWSRADSILVQRRHADGLELALVSVPAGTVRTVARLSAPVGNARSSPDGRWVAFDGPNPRAEGRHEVFVVSERGGEVAAIDTGTSDDALPAWTPDGRGVLFVSDRTGTPGLWLQVVSDGRPGGTPQLITQDLGRVMDVWAATGAGFIYFRQTGLVKVSTVRLDAAGAPLAAAATADTRQLGSTMMPSWSPDGSQLAYQTTMTGTRAIALGVKNVKTGVERQISTTLYFVSPRWAPDGLRVVVKGRDQDGRYGLFLVDVNDGGTTALKIMAPMDEDTLGDYHWVNSQSVMAVIKQTFVQIDVASGREETAFSLGEGFSPRFAVLGPTGAVAFVRRTDSGSTLELREVGTQPRELLRAGPAEAFSDLDWLPNGREILFTRIPTGATATGSARFPALWRYDVETGTASSLGIAMDGLRDLAASPNGRDVAFTTGWPTREPWILENYLPAAFSGLPKR